ncbi:MAG: hypothetical protein C4562_02780 [Actinobacteria bacterium]|nr:MAG: hypothetical protein C4562_02780 [Actinomycetota bacterium]
MIKAQRKGLEEIIKMIGSKKKLLIAGCGTCVSICFAGGDKEVSMLSSELKMALKNKKITINQVVPQRQCEKEFNQEIKDQVVKADLVVSLACGVGVQVLAEQFPKAKVVPGLNTLFMGPPKEQGVWFENCAGCGNCVLDLTGGICPVARCAKNILNGPCGGSQNGKCEVSKDTDCGWQLIVDKLKSQGRLKDINKVWEAKNWQTARDGGPREIRREDLLLKHQITNK